MMGAVVGVRGWSPLPMCVACCVTGKLNLEVRLKNSMLVTLTLTMTTDMRTRTPIPSFPLIDWTCSVNHPIRNKTSDI